MAQCECAFLSVRLCMAQRMCVNVDVHVLNLEMTNCIVSDTFGLYLESETHWCKHCLENDTCVCAWLDLL